jgi:hypothetical protein
MTPNITVIVLAVSLLLQDCGYVDHWQIHDRFDGLRSVYEANNSLDVVIVHGMGHAMAASDDPFSGYSLVLQEGLAGGLGLSSTGADSISFPISMNGVRLGTLVRTEYAGSDARRRLTFYELSWAEAVKPIKTVLLELDGAQGYRERSILEGRRAKLNSAGKAFVNTHLADPIIYSGEFGATLRGIVTEAVCILTRSSQVSGVPCDFRAPGKTSVPIIMITASLGSALVFDTLNELFTKGGDKTRSAIQVAGTATQIYMFANQLPFFELRSLKLPSKETWLDDYPCPKDSPIESANDATSRGLAGFLEIRRLARGPQETGELEPTPLSVVAFSDPNDLLTYFISDRVKQHCSDIRFANVSVTNAHALWLFLAANPVRAHTGYGENDKVIRMVLEGGSP